MQDDFGERVRPSDIRQHNIKKDSETNFSCLATFNPAFSRQVMFAYGAGRGMKKKYYSIYVGVPSCTIEWTFCPCCSFPFINVSQKYKISLYVILTGLAVINYYTARFRYNIVKMIISCKEKLSGEFLMQGFFHQTASFSFQLISKLRLFNFFENSGIYWRTISST